MKNHWLNALIKTIIFLIIAHIVFLLLGFIFQTNIGFLGLPMVWAHWSGSWGSRFSSIVGLVLIYCIIYFAFPGKSDDTDADA